MVVGAVGGHVGGAVGWPLPVGGPLCGGVPCGRTLGVALREGGGVEPLLYPSLTRARAREV